MAIYNTTEPITVRTNNCTKILVKILEIKRKYNTIICYYKSKVNAVTNVIVYKQRIGSKMIAGGLLSGGDSCKGCCTHCDICISCNCKLCNYHHCKWFSPLCYQNHLSSFNADKKISVLINGHMSWVLWCFSFLLTFGYTSFEPITYCVSNFAVPCTSSNFLSVT